MAGVIVLQTMRDGFDEQRAIEQVVRRMADAWNAGDSAAFAGCFADDADFVNVLGEHFRGRSVIDAGHRYILNTIYKGSRVSYTVDAIRAVRPDVAVAFVCVRLMSLIGENVTDPRRGQLIGESMGEAQSRMVLVLGRDPGPEGRWWILSFQNTKIASPVG